MGQSFRRIQGKPWLQEEVLDKVVNELKAGYRADRAWPVDLMPQTSHVEVVMRLTR